MRFSPAALVLAFVTLMASSACAQQEASLQAKMAARRDLEQVKTELRYYSQLEYPRRCRELDAAIECTRAEIENGRRLLRDYRPFTPFAVIEPYPVAVRNLDACIQSSVFRLDDLIAERNALTRFHSDEYRSLAAQVNEARQRVLDLETPAAELPEPQDGQAGSSLR